MDTAERPVSDPVLVSRMPRIPVVKVSLADPLHLPARSSIDHSLLLKLFRSHSVVFGINECTRLLEGGKCELLCLIEETCVHTCTLHLISLCKYRRVPIVHVPKALSSDFGGLSRGNVHCFAFEVVFLVICRSRQEIQQMLLSIKPLTHKKH